MKQKAGWLSDNDWPSQAGGCSNPAELKSQQTRTQVNHSDLKDTTTKGTQVTNKSRMVLATGEKALRKHFRKITVRSPWLEGLL